MFKKSKLIATSAMITLILSNVGSVHANEQEPVELTETYIEQPINYSETFESLIEQLSLVLDEQTSNDIAQFLTENEETVSLFKEGLLLHNDDSYNEAREFYNNLLADNEDKLSEEIEQFIQILVEATEDNLHILEIDYPSEAVHEEPKEEIALFKTQAVAPIKTADAYYKDYQAAYYVSDLWEIGQEFKEAYPNDPRITEVLNDAATQNFEEGRRVHGRGDTSRALIYYNRVLNEETVNNSLKQLASTYKNLTESRSSLKSANDYYQEYQEAHYVSNLWEISQEFKTLYPNDRRSNEVVNDAATKNLAEGRRVHNRRDLERAIIYYDRVLSEPLVNRSTQKDAEKYKNQALGEKDSKQADVLYEQYQKAYYVSDLWEISQAFKLEFPNDLRVQEVMNHAATKNLAEGRRVHVNGNHDRAAIYYERVLNEPLVSETLKSEARLFNRILADGVNLKSANEYNREFQKATLVSNMWEISQEFKAVYPRDSRIKQVVNHAAIENLKEGRRVHNRGDFQRALIYYNRVMGEELVEPETKNEAVLGIRFAEAKTKVKSAKQYAAEYQKAYYVSDLWAISQEFRTAYPNNSQANRLLNDAAIENLKEGRRLHRNKNYSRASIYYTRIMNEPGVNKSTRHLAEVYNKQTQASHKPLVYIDPGHGGYDPGPVFGGTSEKVLNLNVSRYLKNELEAKGYQVVMSRETDRFIDLTPRAAEANRLGADIFVSVHHNSMGGSGSARGIETFIHHTLQNAQRFGQETNRNNFSDNPRIQDSVSLADNIHRNLIRSTGFYNRGVKGNNFNVLRNTYIPAVLLELGFMDNSTELSIIRTQSYQRKAAKAIADGIDSYFKNIVR